MLFTLLKPYLETFLIFCKKKWLVDTTRTNNIYFLYSTNIHNFLVVALSFFFKNLNCRNSNCPNLNSRAPKYNYVLKHVKIFFISKLKLKKMYISLSNNSSRNQIISGIM